MRKNDGFAYRVVARTSKRYCEFRLKIDASANGYSQTITVDDHGLPFRVSGLICGPADAIVPCPKFSAYQRTYAGGVANPDRRTTWVPKDSKTYEGV